MKFQRSIPIMAFTAVTLLAAIDVSVIYVKSGQPVDDKLMMSSLKQQFTDNSNYTFHFLEFNTLDDANAQADVGHDEYGSPSVIVMHGREEGDKSIDTVVVSGQEVVVTDASFKSDKFYYCYQHGGGEIWTDQMATNFNTTYGE